MAAVDAKRLLYVYPPVGDENPIVFLMTANTDIKELRKLICAEFGVSDSPNISLDYFDPEVEHTVVVPLSSAKSFVFQPGKPENIAFRVRTYGSSGATKPSPKASAAQPADPWENDRYFKEYGKIGIHWHMLRDKARCETYQRAMQLNAHTFKDAVVLDVGCGTSILSIFAAQAGAKKVYAVEASSMFDMAKKVVKRNKVDHIVEVIHGRIEDVALPVPQVDIIISEWMGVFLLFESMLDSVLFARNKWLRPGGLMLPSFARMYVAPIKFDDFYDERVKVFEKPVCGVDVSDLVPIAEEHFTGSAMKGFKHLEADHVIEEGSVFHSFDLHCVHLEDIRAFSAPFLFKPSQPHFHGFATWFDVDFKIVDPTHSKPSEVEVPVAVPAPAEGKVASLTLSTHPKCPKTHWYQDVFLLGETIKLNTGDTIRGQIDCKQHLPWRRHYEATFTFSVKTTKYEKEFVL